MDVDLTKKGFVFSREGEKKLHYKMDESIGEGSIFIYPMFRGIDVFFVDIAHANSGLMSNEDMPRYYELSFCSCGCYRADLDREKEICMYPGSLSIMKNYLGMHKTKIPDESFKGFCLLLCPDSFCDGELDYLREVFDIDIRGLCAKLDSYPTAGVYPCDEELHRVCNEMHSLLEMEKMEHFKIKLLEFFCLFHIGLDRELQLKYKRFSRSQMEKAQRLKELIDADITRHHTIEALSKEGNLCGTTLKRCFKTMYQYPPYEYLVRRRMSVAAMKLRDTSKSILQISEEVGYSNASNFTRMFKKIYAMNPKEYRESKKVPAELKG